MRASLRASLALLATLLAAANVHARPSPNPAVGVDLRPTARDLVGVIVDILDLNTTCNSIAQAVSDKSKVAFPGSFQYAADNEHWASSSSDASCCSVQPGTAEDVAAIVRILCSSANYDADLRRP